MNTVVRGFAGNTLNTTPELGVPDDLFRHNDWVADYNHLVGTARESLLLPAAYALEENHFDAAALLVAAQVELCQAGCVKPQPPMRRDPYIAHNTVFNIEAVQPPITGPVQKLGHIATWRARRQTAAFMRTVRESLVHTRLAVEDPLGQMPPAHLVSNSQPAGSPGVSLSVPELYSKFKITYWDEACMAVRDGASPRRPSAVQTAKWPGKEGAVRSSAMNVVQLSMVLDAARGDIWPSILQQPSLTRRLLEAFKLDNAVVAAEGINSSLRARHVMQTAAQKALIGYVNRTQPPRKRKHGVRLVEDPQSYAIAALIGEVDRFDMLYWLDPKEYPNAKAINMARSRRVWDAKWINPQWDYLIPEAYKRRVFEITEYFRRYG